MSEESREMTVGKEEIVMEKRRFMTYKGVCFRLPEGLVVPSDLGSDYTLPSFLPPLSSRRRRLLVPIDQNIPRSPPPLKHPTRNVRPMTLEEECNLHNYQVRTSAGFDVTATPGAYICSQISPLELNYQETMDLCEKLYQNCHLNLQLQDTEGELEFVEVVKAMYQLIQRSCYYLTFKAVNLGNQVTNTYQAVVQSAGDDSGFQVLRCRLKPDSDTNEGKWFWDDDEHGHLGSG